MTVKFYTVAEFKAMIGAPVECPKCGCQATKVISTWDTATGKRRQRVCLHCDTPMPTIEIPLPSDFQGEEGR